MIVRVDVDAGRKPLTAKQICWRLRRGGYRLRWLSQRRSPSGTGWHLELQVTPAPRSCFEAVALQSVLGSDLAHEACNLNRARMVETGQVRGWWAKRWNVLYRKGWTA